MRRITTFITIVMVIALSISLISCNGANIERYTGENGIVLEGGNFGKGATIKAEVIDAKSEKGSEAIREIAEREYKEDGQLYIVDVQVTKGEEELQPETKIKITIPCEFEEGAEVVVFEVGSDGQIREHEVTVADGKVVIETDKVARLIIAESTGRENAQRWHYDEECHWHLDENGEVIDKASHTFGEIISLQPGSQAGEPNQNVVKCTVCGYEKTEPIVNPNHGEHQATTWTIKDSFHLHVCTICSTEYDVEDHKFDDGVIRETNGRIRFWKVYTCEICGFEKKEPMTSEDHNDHVAQVWTQTETEHWHDCLICNEVYDKGEHEFDEGVTIQSERTQKDEILYTCTICGYEKRVTEDGHIHMFGEWKTTAPNESQHYRECECGEREVAEHVWNEGVVIQEPSNEHPNGITLFTCLACGYEKQIELHVHNFGEWHAADPDDGNHYCECACGEEKVEEHQWEKVEPTQEPNPENPTEVYACTVCGHTKSEEKQ